MLQCETVHPADETVFSLCELGEEVRRYLSGPPGPQGPPGPPGTSVGISASYSVDEIATYVFSMMNSELKTSASVEVKLLSYLSNCLFQVEGLLEDLLDLPVLLVPLVQEGLALPRQRLTILS